MTIFTSLLLLASLQSTELISEGTGGLGINNLPEVDSAAITPDGRFIVFSSHATDVVPGDTNSRQDVFLVDTQTGITELISRNMQGVPANGNSSQAMPSADGRYVAFTSSATDLITNGPSSQQVYVYDRIDQRMELVSRNTDGAVANSSSVWPVISRDGRYVAFKSSGSNMHPQVTSTWGQAYLRDRVSETTTLLSVTTDGVYRNTDALPYDVSADGSAVLFTSDQSNLVANDSNGQIDAFVRDVNAGSTERVSLGVNGEANSRIYLSRNSMSLDGRFVVFWTQASNLVANDTDNWHDVFLRDRSNGTTVRITSGHLGTGATGNSRTSALSVRGDYVVFVSGADNLVPFDFNNSEDVFVWSRHTGATIRVSLTDAGLEPNDDSFFGAISGNGERVTFISDATDVISGVTGRQLYLRNVGSPDFDGDALPDDLETAIGTATNDVDSDDDALSDFDDYVVQATDPLARDTDADGVQDGTELGLTQGLSGNPGQGILGTDSNLFQPDQDPNTTTNPLDSDTDDDALTDGGEDGNADGATAGSETAPEIFDTDGDRLGDGQELGRTNGVADTDLEVFVPDGDPNTTTDPTRADTDGGGVEDGIEDFNRDGVFQLGETDPNRAADDDFDLTVGSLTPGQQATIQTSAGKAGAVVRLLLSVHGGGPTTFMGVDLDLTPPVEVFPMRVVDPVGTAFWTLQVPNNAPSGAATWWQAVEIFSDQIIRLSEPRSSVIN